MVARLRAFQLAAVIRGPGSVSQPHSMPMISALFSSSAGTGTGDELRHDAVVRRVRNAVPVDVLVVAQLRLGARLGHRKTGRTSFVASQQRIGTS